MSTITAASGGGNWSATTTWTGGVVPTSADDVVLAATSGNVTIDAAAACRSLDASAYTGTLTHNGFTLSVGDATAGAGSNALLFSTSMTYTNGAGGSSAEINFVSTSATQQNVSLNSKSHGNIVFNGAGGSWKLTSAINTSLGFLLLNAGSLTTNNLAVTVLGVNASGSTTTRSLTLGTSTITLGASSWNMGSGTGLTLSAASSTIIGNASNGSNFAGAGATYNNVTYSTIGNGLSVSGANTFHNFTFSSAGNTYDSIVFAANNTFTGTLTINGTGTGLGRVLIAGGTVGTNITLTAAAVSFSYADFRDITGAGAASWNLASITGNSGDCGGNSGITFTTAATQTYATGAAANWSTAASWAGSPARVPLPQDNVVVPSGTTGTLVVDMNRMGHNVDVSAFTGTLNFNNVANRSECYGNFTASNSITYGTGTAGLYMMGRSASTVNVGNRNFPNTVFIYAPGTTCTLGATTSLASLSVQMGTFDTSTFNLIVNTNITVAAGATANFNSVTVSLNGSSTVLSGSATATITATAAVFNLPINSATRSINNWQITGATLNYTVNGSTGQLNFGGTVGNWDTFNCTDTTNGRTIQFAANGTFTFGTFNVQGSSGKLMTIQSSIAGTRHNLSKASGTVSCDYLAIKDSAAGGGAGWYAGNNSTDNGNNTGWVFTAPPTLKSDTDTGAFSEAQSLVYADTTADTGFTTDTQSLSSGASSSDTAIGAEAGAVTATETSADTGAFAEAWSLAATESAADTGAFTDTESLYDGSSTPVSDADTGAFADTEYVTEDNSLISETGTFTDTGVVDILVDSPYPHGGSADSTSPPPGPITADAPGGTVDSTGIIRKNLGYPVPSVPRPTVPGTRIEIFDWRGRSQHYGVKPIYSRKATFNLLDNSTASFTLPGNDPSKLPFDIDNPNPIWMAPLLKKGITDFYYWRGREILGRFRLVQRDTKHDANTYTLTCGGTDYRGLLARRWIYQDNELANKSPEFILNDVLNKVQSQPGGDYGFDLTRLPVTGANVPDFAYQATDNVWQIIKNLAATEPAGFDFEIDENLTAWMYYPYRSNRFTGAVLDHGGTAEEMNFSDNMDAYADFIQQTGVQGSAPVTVASPSLGHNPHGRWDLQFSDQSLMNAAMITAAANYNAKNAAQDLPSVSITMKPGRWGGKSDFWLGDLVRVVDREIYPAFDAYLRVSSMDITVDANGYETVVVTAGLPRIDYMKALVRTVKTIAKK